MELTNAEWKEVVNAGVDTIYRWPRVRQAINDVLSRRTAEPHPAEPSPAPSGDVALLIADMIKRYKMICHVTEPPAL